METFLCATTNWKDPAVRRYISRLVVAMVFYVAAIFLATWSFQHRHPHGIPAYLLAMLPAIPLLAVIAIFGTYLTELRDEFIRTIMVHSSLWATGVTLAFASCLGFLQQYVGGFNLPMYYLFVLWWVAFALVQPLVGRKYK